MKTDEMKKFQEIFVRLLDFGDHIRVRPHEMAVCGSSKRDLQCHVRARKTISCRILIGTDAVLFMNCRPNRAMLYIKFGNLLFCAP